MQSLRAHKFKVALAIVVIGVFVAWYQARQEPPPAPVETHERQNTGYASSESQATKFDLYLMVMTWHAAFCADGHDRASECAARPPRPLVIHGLWPERLQPGTYPHDCQAPALHLDPALAAELEEYMPGMRADLHAHERRKHGACAGLDADTYFRDALGLARDLDAALTARLTTLAGRETSSEALRDYADQFRPGLGATLVFQCRTLRDAQAAKSARPFLVEVRQCIDNDGANGAPGTPLDCAGVNRRDQGCGGSFFVAGAKLWK